MSLPPQYMDDRLYMAESVESRIPFMDYRLVQLAVRVPYDLKIKNGYTKYIMRKAYEDKLPGEVVWRTNKMGFGAPVDKWKRAFGRDYIIDRIKGARLGGLFNLQYLKRLCDEKSTADELFRFFQMEILSEQFDVTC